MSVLTLAGKPIDWRNPPAPTARVKWSKPDMYGRAVTGSLRPIAFIDHLDTPARKKYNAGVVIIQPPYNDGVAASAGTHDYDACFDWYIPGVAWPEQNRFARANGMANWLRTPPAFGYHQHGFPLPPREGTTISDDFKVAGFKVGKYVDGGYSLYGRAVASSQLEDYYNERTGLSGHAHDPSWFPANKAATIFNLNDYIRRQRRALVPVPKGQEAIAHIESHGPLARLGGAQGEELWEDWEASIRAEANSNIRAGVTTLLAVDSNHREGLPNFGAGLRRIGGKGIDLLAKRQAKNGAKVKVIKRRSVNMHIDGHDCYGTKVKVTFPSGKTATYWYVLANFGRGVEAEVFTRTAKRIRKAFGENAIYCFLEVDEADKPEEKDILLTIFPESEFRWIAKSRLSPMLVGRKVKVEVLSTGTKVASPGMAKVSPARVMVETVVGPKTK